MIESDESERGGEPTRGGNGHRSRPKIVHSLWKWLRNLLRRESKLSRARREEVAAERKKKLKDDQDQFQQQLRQKIEAAYTYPNHSNAYKQDDKTTPTTSKLLNHNEEIRLAYITHDTLKNTLTRDDIAQLFSPYAWFKSKDEIPIHGRYLRILATLLTIGWDRWEQFYDLFLSHNGERSDDRVPFHPPSEGDLSFLGQPIWQESFYAKQFIFRPFEFTEGKHHDIHDDYHLPIRELQHLGHGSSATVTCIEVDRYCHRKLIPGLDSYESNTSPSKVARKTFNSTNHPDYIRERQTSENLKQSKDRKQDECKALQAINLPILSYNYANRGNLLFEKADTDLDRLFYGPLPDLRDLDHQFTPFHVLGQLKSIAEALAFLHEDERKYMHLDLKPANIVIFFFSKADDPDNYNKFPAGLWKIIDLGLSREGLQQVGVDVQKRVESIREVASARTRSSVPSPRNDGQYLPPETRYGNRRVSRFSDCWSLACILCEALAFLLGQRREVRDFEKTRRLAATADTPYTNYSFFVLDKTSEPQVNPSVVGWLKRLPSDDWIVRLKELISDLLKPERNGRIPAREAAERLDSIQQSTAGMGQLWVPAPANECADSGSTSPAETIGRASPP
jgi:serine/threonine protein kinase